jgi:branched-chain amino acid transport system ATP-binding protein
MLLDIKHLNVFYGRAEALKGISINVEDRFVVSIVGANGAGKTTILRTISGLKKAASGEIWFGSVRIDRLAAYQIVKLGIAHIPEGRVVFAPMTVTDNLKIGAYTRQDKNEIAKDLAAMHQHFPILEQRGGQLAGSLSGGEQQMLAIARALMAKPKLLLMDEPSMGLAPKMVEEVGRMIRTINQSGVGIILVEQNARLALKLSHYAYVLEVGRITLGGVARELAHDERVKKAYLGG